MTSMTRRILGSVAGVAILLGAACGGEKGSNESTAESVAARAEAPGAASVLASDVAGGEAELLAKGEALFNQVCIACHTMQPPPNLAPPMMGIAGHYHEAFTDRDEAVNWMVAYIQSPHPSKSKLSEEAFQRFGTMPALPLPEADLRAVMTWVWDMYDADQDPRPSWERAGDGGP